MARVYPSITLTLIACAPVAGQSSVVPVFLAENFALSGDGLTAVGTSRSSPSYPGKWSMQGGTVSFVTSGLDWGYAYGVSPDGGFAVGSYNSQPFRWSQSTGLVLLPVPPGTLAASDTAAIGVDLSGSVIAGHVILQTFPPNLGPVVWINGVPQLLPLMGPGETRVRGISGNGLRVIATWLNSNGYYWSAAEGNVPIPTPPQLPGGVFPRTINFDGSIIVGSINPNAGTGWQPLRWRVGLGVEVLPKLPGFPYCFGRGVSDDGRTVVGYCQNSTATLYRAYIWREGRGTVALADLLAQLGITVPTGIELARAIGVSASGLVITGQGPLGAGGNWIVELPCPANCDGSTAAPVLNVADFICFLNRFAAGDTRANCDASTTPPVLSVADFVCFQTQFAAGCP